MSRPTQRVSLGCPWAMVPGVRRAQSSPHARTQMPRLFSRRAFATISAAGLALAGAAATVESAAPATAGGAESSRMLSDLQSARASAGLGPLAVDGELSA